MPTSFLDLPREIRDQIYEFVLISPTGYIHPEPLPRRLPPPPNARNASTIHTSISKEPRFILVIVTPTKKKLHTTSPTSGSSSSRRRIKDGQQTEGKEYITLSLLSTNQQIYHETSRLFWEKNTFHFPSSALSSNIIPTTVFSIDELPVPTIGILPTLKAMSQTASRLITSLSLCMPPLNRTSMLPKLLQVLRSRSRYGNFRRLELSWGRRETMELVLHQGSLLWDKMIAGFWTAGEGCRFERVVRLDVIGLDMDDSSGIGSVAGEISGALGGSVFFGELLVWEDGKRVG